MTFEIYKINDIYLSKNDGLVKAAGIKASDYLNASGAADTGKVTSAGSKETANGGVAVWDSLPIGAYLVVETGPKAGYTPAAPFLAFVPMTQGNAGAQGTTWNYDVHAYPKNYEKTQPVKTVVDINQNIGGTISYDIDTVVGTIAEGKRLAYYYISDTLDVENLDVSQADSHHGTARYDVSCFLRAELSNWGGKGVHLCNPSCGSARQLHCEV